MSHPSLLFPHGHFETTPDYDFTDNPIHMILPYFPVLKAQDTRHSAPASRSLATWPDQMQTQEKNDGRDRAEIGELVEEMEEKEGVKVPVLHGALKHVPETDMKKDMQAE